MITSFSTYKSMTAKHKMQQPRRILESKSLKHIHNVSYNFNHNLNEFYMFLIFDNLKYYHD